jgi:hypothetical protein
MHSLTAVELDAIASLSNSIHMAFFGGCFGGMVSFGIVLQTGSVVDPKTHAEFVALFAVSALGALYCGLMGVIDYAKGRKKLNDIKAGKQ